MDGVGNVEKLLHDPVERVVLGLQHNIQEVVDGVVEDTKDAISSLTQLLQRSGSGKKTKIVTDTSKAGTRNGNNGHRTKKKDSHSKHSSACGPKALEDYKQRLWLVHLQRPQIKFQAVNTDAVLMGANSAFVQGFGFHLELLPSNKGAHDVDYIRQYMPPQDLIYRLEYTTNKSKYYETKMPYFKIRIC